MIWGFIFTIEDHENDQRQDTNFTLDNIINRLHARWAFEVTKNKSEFTLRRKSFDFLAKIYMNKIIKRSKYGRN